MRGRFTHRLGLVLASGLFACAESAAERKPAPEGVEVALIDADGPELLARIRGASAPFVFVNAWATWCQPCIEEFPELVRFAAEHPPPEAELLFVSTDFKSEREGAERFMRASGARLPGYFKKGGDMEFIDSLSPKWSGAIPATFLFSREGALLELWQGKVSFAQLEAALARARTTSPKASGGTP